VSDVNTEAAQRRAKRRVVVLAGLGVLLAFVSFARLVIGDSWGWPEGPILEIRATRLGIGVIVGVALSVSGAVLQALLRNPLASPYILGLSSGATLGYVVVGFLPLLGWTAGESFGVDQLGAFLGAIGVMVLVYLLSQRRGWVDPIAVLLVGVVINAMNGAAIMLLSAIASQNYRSSMTLWMLGYFNDHVSAGTVVGVGVVTLLGTGVAIALGRAMDVAVFSDSEAHSLGLHLPRLRLKLFVVAGLLTAGSVLLAGPIGFVGLVCPHFVRLLIGPRHRPLLIGSALAGASLVVGADTALRAIDKSLLPIGVVTALVGGPVFLFFLWPQIGKERAE